MSQLSSLAHKASHTTATPPSYLWEVPGKPVAVQFALELIDRIDRDAVENFRSIEARGSEIGGLLYGSVIPGSPAAVWVDDFELISCDYSRGPLYRLSDADTGRFAEAIEKRQAEGASQVVGFFRSHTRKGLGLDADDMALLTAKFQDPAQIALLVRPFASKATMAGVFIWEGAQMRQDASYLEFPFQAIAKVQGASETASSQRDTGIAPQRTATPVAPPQARSVTRAQVVPMTSRLKIATPAPPALAPATPPPAPAPAPVAAPPAPAPVAAQAAPAVPAAEPQTPPAALPSDPIDRPAVTERRKELFEYGRAVEPAAESPRRGKLLWIGIAAALLLCSGVLFVYPGIARHTARPPIQSAVPLTLRVERTATDLLLTWNRDSDAIKNAKHAVLSISDGDRQENVEMNMADLRNGSIMYSPLTGDTSFRMETTGPDGSKTATESVRVLRTKPSPLAVPDPKAAQAVKTDPAAAAAAAQAATAQAPVPEPTPVKRQARAFNVASLSERLRPAPAAADVPDAPTLSSSPAAAVNLGAIAPSQMRPLTAPTAPAAQSTPAPVSRDLVASRLVTRVDPVYPTNARGASGEVHVQAVIGKDGRIKSTKVLSGPVVLQRAAAEAVEKWVYTPTLLDGKPVETDKEIVINFTRK